MINIQDLFDVQFPGWLAQHPERAKTIGVKFQITITGPGGGEWLIDTSATGPSIKQGTFPADVGITVSVETAQQLFDDPTKGMLLFMSRKLEINGNFMMAMKLGELMKLGD